MKFSNNKLLYIRRALFVLLIIITAVFQNAKGAVPSIAGVHAVLLVPLTVSIAMHEKSISAMLFGAFGGIMLDMFSSAADGFFAVTLTVIAFVCSLLVTFEMRNNILTALLMSFCSSFLCTFFYWLFFFLIKHYDMAAYVYFRYYFTSAIYTTVFVFIYYYIVRWICSVTAPERKRVNY
ncbi:MAG: hypothetical protein ACI4GY_07225 [Acutalibacteraceae bacterium]